MLRTWLGCLHVHVHVCCVCLATRKDDSSGILVVGLILRERKGGAEGRKEGGGKEREGGRERERERERERGV